MHSLIYLFLLLSLTVSGQGDGWNLGVGYGSGVGRNSAIEQYREYGLRLDRAVAAGRRWSLSVGADVQRRHIEIVSDNVSFTVAPLVTGFRVSPAAHIKDYRIQLSLVPQFTAVGTPKINGPQSRTDRNPEGHRAVLERRHALEAGIGLVRLIGSSWSVGLEWRSPLIAPLVNFSRDIVICPFSSPCTSLEDYIYDSLPLRQSVLSILVARSF